MGRFRPLAVAVAALTLAATALAACGSHQGTGGPLLVADVGSLSPQDQITYAALEGIVNRDGPNIYLENLKNGQDFTVDTAARLWLHDAVPMTHRQVSAASLITTFRPDINGLVIWDPAFPVGSQNVATTVAGVDDLLPVSPAQAAVLEQAPYSLPVVDDLRRLHFTSGLRAYQWAFANLRPDGGFAFPAWLGATRNGRAVQPGLRDWIVARRGFAFEADPQTQPSLVQFVLSHFPSMTPVFGYPYFDDALYAKTGVALGEPAGIGEISRAGDFLIPTTDATNLSALNHFQVSLARPAWRAMLPAAPSSIAPATSTAAAPVATTTAPSASSIPITSTTTSTAAAPVAATTYVCFIISDGDNVGTDETVLRGLHWSETARGTLPIATSMSPWLARLEPTVYNYYVRTMERNDSFVASPSGAGYAYPSEMPDLGRYLTLSKSMMAAAGLKAVWILDNGYLTSPGRTTVDQYVRALNPPIIFTDYSTLSEDEGKGPTPLYVDAGVPVIGSVWGLSVDQTVSAIRAAAGVQPAGGPRFVFVGLSAWSMSYAKAAQVMAEMGPSYQAVSPATFAALISPGA